MNEPRRTRPRWPALLAAALVPTTLAACKSKPADPPPTPEPRASTAAPVDAAAADANLDGCRAALPRIAGLPPAQRTLALLQACQPCGDWTPLVAWDTPPDKGGPTRAAIERAMLACGAYCEPTAKQQFLGALDAARGQGTRGPWRYLGEVCKGAVSALPDGRFMSGTYFALDRIARALGDSGALAALELPLPAFTITGAGVELPTAPVDPAEPGRLALTVDARQLLLGTFLSASLSAGGVAVHGDYPGPAVPAAGLPAAITKALAAAPTPAAPATASATGAPSSPAAAPAIAVLAPSGLTATRVVEAAAASGGRNLQLAVAARGLPGWPLPGLIPVTLGGAAAPGAARIALGDNAFDAIKAAQATTPAERARAPLTIAVAPSATVESLASLLGALAYLEVRAVALVAAQPSARKP